MRAQYDWDADCLYIQLTDEPVSRTETLDAGTLVDLDRRGQLRGIEVIRPARPWPLEKIINRYPLSEQDARILRQLPSPGQGERYLYGPEPLVAG